MNAKKDCEIVQDLLPNYIEKLTNSETNKYIEEHLKKCANCEIILNNMQDDCTIQLYKKCESETKYLKKFNRKFNSLLITVLLIFIILFAMLVHKIMLVNTLCSNAEKMISKIGDNSYTKKVEYSSNSMNTVEIYMKDGNFLGKASWYKYGKENINNAVYYNYENNGIIHINDENGKRILYDKIENIENFPYTIININLKNILLINFQKVTLEGKDCYMIRYKNTEQFIERKTGLLLKYIDNNQNTTTDYYYEFNKVTDNDIEKPDGF